MASAKDGWVVWKGHGMAFDGQANSGFSIPLDTGIAEGGGTGSSPMELVLVGLAGCTAMDVISILQKKRQDVTGFEVHAHGVRTDEHPKVYTDITLEYVVRGNDVEPEAVARAIELSENKYCSVMGMLKQAVNITTTYRVEAADALGVGIIGR